MARENTSLTSRASMPNKSISSLNPFASPCVPDLPILLPLFTFGRCLPSNTNSTDTGILESLARRKKSVRSSGCAPRSSLKPAL